MLRRRQGKKKTIALCHFDDSIFEEVHKITSTNTNTPLFINGRFNKAFAMTNGSCNAWWSMNEPFEDDGTLTLEFFVLHTSSYGATVVLECQNGPAFRIITNSSGMMYISSSINSGNTWNTVLSHPHAINNNSWAHVCITIFPKTNQFLLHISGMRVAEGLLTNYSVRNSITRVMAANSYGSGIDELRLSRVARYGISNLTPPVAPFIVD